MKNKIPITASIILLIILVTGCSKGVSLPKIELSTTYFDLGDINPDEGKRTEIFSIKNIGTAPLNIISVSTSCGCTEAKAESNEIPPGEQIRLTVTYDPSVHPDLTGKIKRVVYIKSNDLLNEEVELELVGNSLPSSKSKTNVSEGGSKI